MMIVALEEIQQGQSASPRYVVIREICGTEELSDLSPGELVAHLVVGGSVLASELTLSEQDRVLVEVYRSIYGDDVECFALCTNCGREYEVSFALDDWLDALRDVDGPVAIRSENGVFELPPDDQHGRLRFCLPTEATLWSVSGWDAEETAAALRRASVVEGDPEDPRLEPAMARVGPLLDDEIETECAYCNTPQAVAFRLADFLAAALSRERPLASREVHYLARAYHWSRDEILRLPRTLRREHVRLVLAEAGATEDSWP